MRLTDYKKQEGLTDKELSARLGYSRSTVRKWLDGDRRPGEEQMQRIAVATDFAVGPLDFYGEWAQRFAGATA